MWHVAQALITKRHFKREDSLNPDPDPGFLANHYGFLMNPDPYRIQVRLFGDKNLKNSLQLKTFFDILDPKSTTYLFL